MLALRVEHALGIHEHETAVVLDAAIGAARFLERDALQALDGVDVERGDGDRHAAIVSNFRASMDDYSISSDPARLDIDVIHGYLSQSYWSPGIPRAVVERAIANSMCFGIFK